jgi:hypothetical protein
MKSYLFSGKIGLLMAFFVASFGIAFGQNDKKAEIAELIKSRQFVFKAQSATPTSGRSRQLTSEYGLRVKPDTVISALPFFGRAYSAPIDATKGGIDFTSTDFEYEETEGKKGGWDIEIKPKDHKDVQQMFLSIAESGYGTLQVRSNSRQNISFYGYVDKPGKRN